MARAPLGGPGTALAHPRDRAFPGAFRRAAPRAGPARGRNRGASLSARYGASRLAAPPADASRPHGLGGLRQRLRLAPALQLHRHFSFAARRGRAAAEPRVARARAEPRVLPHRASRQGERPAARAARRARPAAAVLSQRVAAIVDPRGPRGQQRVRSRARLWPPRSQPFRGDDARRSGARPAPAQRGERRRPRLSAEPRLPLRQLFLRLPARTLRRGRDPPIRRELQRERRALQGAEQSDRADRQADGCVMGRLPGLAARALFVAVPEPRPGGNPAACFLALEPGFDR